MLITILIIFLMAFIAFSIWNTINLHHLLKRPLKSDHLNDKHYWELKYKMQYMITVFAVIVAIISFLGYSSISNIRQSIRSEMTAQLDSTKRVMDSIEKRQSQIDLKISYTDSSLQNAQNAIIGLSDRERYLNGSLSLSGTDLEKLKKRIQEINEKNIIQQNIYIVDNVEYPFGDEWIYKKYFFKDFITNTGQKLPEFKKAPFILPVSNTGVDFGVNAVTENSFELIISNNTIPGELPKIQKLTLFITVNP